jgi:hypothetical protein
MTSRTDGDDGEAALMLSAAVVAVAGTGAAVAAERKRLR